MKKAHLIRVYREAARMIAQGEETFSCCAVDWSASNPGIFSDERLLYSEVMCPGELLRMSICLTPEGQAIRVLLLLLMAEWVQTDYEEQ